MAASTETTARSAVYREAARMLSAEEYAGGSYGCCDFISFAVKADACAPAVERHAFESMFEPVDSRLSYWGDQWADADDERRECRVLALCFMAAMVEAGDA